jgi:hypothetical protein
MSNQHANTTSTFAIPVRNSATTWANVSTNPVHQVGQDYVVFDISCKLKVSDFRLTVLDGNRSNSAVCDKLDDINEFVNYDPEKCQVVIGVKNVNLEEFHIG